MKTILAALAGLIAMGGFTATSYAQVPGTNPANPPAGNRPPIQQVSGSAPASPPTMPGTRVAVVNINSVLKNYNKAQALNSSIKTKVQSYAERMNKLKEEVAKIQAELPKPTTTATLREQYEKQVVMLQRQLQDLDNEARKVISADQASIAVQIFKEIEQVINAVALQNNFDLVLSFPDSTTKDDLYSQDNVVRKLASQAAIPIFYKKHIDLTDAVITTLNISFPAPPPTPGAPAILPNTPATPPK